MKADARVGGRRTKNDVRDLRNWCGKLNLTATTQEDVFILAALRRALFGADNEAKALRKAIAYEAHLCWRDHSRKANQP